MKLQSILNYIDAPIERVAKAVSWFTLAFSLILVYDVAIARPVLNSPTIWSYDITYMLCGSMFMLASAHVLRIGGHIRIDFLYERFSPRRKAIIDLIFYAVIFLPLTVVLVIYSTGWVWTSWQWKEVLPPEPTLWQGPLYPFKTVLPVALFLLVIPGIAEFIRNLAVVVKGTER